MHEHGITNEVVHQILHYCEDYNIKNPKEVNVELGMLTTYKKDPVLFYFESAKENYPILKNAVLNIKEIQGKIKCETCKKENDVESSPLILCPNCDSQNVTIIQGKKISISIND